MLSVNTEMRPKKDVDPGLVQKLASIGCTNQEIGEIVGCSHDTLTRRFASELQEGRANGKMSLRRKQYELAINGNVTMLVWLGKQMLGQSDRQEIKTDNSTDNKITLSWGSIDAQTADS